MADESWDQFGPAYDFPEFQGRPNLYLIASVPRSGSHLLARLLFETGRLGSPLEYFAHCQRWQSILGAGNLSEVIERLIRRRTSPNGHFGVKTHFAHFGIYLNDPQLPARYPVDRYIFIDRSDKVGQAVSLALANRSGMWISFAGKQPDHYKYNFEFIFRSLELVAKERSSWLKLFSERSIQPIEVEYEDLVRDPDRQVSKIVSAFGLTEAAGSDRPPSVPWPERQAGALNRIWKQMFLEEMDRKGIDPAAVGSL